MRVQASCNTIAGARTLFVAGTADELYNCQERSVISTFKSYTRLICHKMERLLNVHHNNKTYPLKRRNTRNLEGEQMNTKVIIAIVGLLLVAATFVAGCTSLTASPTPSPSSTPVPTVKATPTPSPGPEDAAKYFTGILTNMKFAIRQPLGHSINSIGNDVYRGTVARGTTTATVEIQTFQNIYDTQQGAQSYINNFKGQGYVTRDDQSTYWSGQKPTGEAWIIVDTTDMYVMAFWY
jgi:hypothetical protein